MKYKYDFGIKDLSIYATQYAQNAAFVSKPYNVEGNVSQVSLIAIEDHPIFSYTSNVPVSDRCTSIEYYVSNELSPSVNQWTPILPVGENSVRNELMFFDDKRSAKLRFTASPLNATVYRNGEKIPSSDWTFASGGNSVVITNNFIPASQYTIDYTPSGDPHNINFTNNIVKKYEETFNGTDRNMIATLKYYPYINYSKINSTVGYNPNTSAYKPIQVYLEETDIMGPGRVIYPNINPEQGATTPCTKNKTDYLKGIVPTLTDYHLDNSPTFEYYQDKNQLFFTETFNRAEIRENMSFNHGNAKIRVAYEYTSSSIRIKIVLRRTTHISNEPVTPVVKEFSLRMKVV